jgi:CheY-like chemotaxis protein
MSNQGPRKPLVLIVDDDDDVRELAATIVESLGYSVLSAANGNDALEALAQHPETDLLFTDIVMPGINGFELAERAIAARPALKVLYTTGYASKRQAGSTVPGKVLAKPYRHDALKAELRHLLPR